MNQKKEFIAFINSHKNLILKVASIYCSDTEDRKDLVQEIILQLWKSFPKYNPNYKLSTWSYRIALNVSISYVRKTTNRNKAINRYGEFIEYKVEDKPFQEDGNLNKLYKALEILNPIDRAIITLNLDGCGNKEISDIMGMSPSNVSTRILRIKKKLKKHLTN